MVNNLPSGDCLDLVKCMSAYITRLLVPVRQLGKCAHKLGSAFFNELCNLRGDGATTSKTKRNRLKQVVVVVAILLTAFFLLILATKKLDKLIGSFAIR